MDAQFWIALAGIVWIDLLLSGDNAVIIAVIANGLPEHQRRWGMIYGTAAAILLRIGGALAASWLMGWPALSILIGLYLVKVAVDLVTAGEDDGGAQKPATTLTAAVTAIALADIGMSLDNVMAVAGLANGNDLLMALGIVLSIIFMMVGAVLIMRLVTRYPFLKWLGSALLGWVAGGIILHDPLLQGVSLPAHASTFASALGAAVVVLIAVTVGAFRSLPVEAK